MPETSFIGVVTAPLSNPAMEAGATILAVGGRSSQANEYIELWANIIGGIAASLIVISYLLAAVELSFKKGKGAEGTKAIGHATMVHALALLGISVIWGIARAMAMLASRLNL